MRADRLRQDVNRAVPWLLATAGVSLFDYFAFIRGAGLPLDLAVVISVMFGGASVVFAYAFLGLMGDVRRRYFTEDEGDAGGE